METSRQARISHFHLSRMRPISDSDSPSLAELGPSGPSASTVIGGTWCGASTICGVSPASLQLFAGHARFLYCGLHRSRHVRPVAEREDRDSLRVQHSPD